MRALGHKAIWDPKNDKFLAAGQGYNVLVEGFNDGIVSVIADGYNKGARFLCIATEEPTDKGFNHGTQPEMVKRQADFVKASSYLDGILHLVPGEGVTRWYSQHAPAAYVELGYAPTLVRTDATVPEYDFGFYGTLSKRRHVMLRKLARKVGTVKAVRIVANFATQVERDRAMRQAKVIVQIRKFDEMGLVSSSRCNTALCLGRPVVAEPHELSNPWDEVVTFAKTDDEFLDLAIGVRAAWQGIHAAQFERFKMKLGPERCIGMALRAIGVTGGRRAT